MSWCAVGQISEERVCHNHSPLAKWRIDLRFGPPVERADISEAVAIVKALDHRAIFLNYCVIFADLDAALLFQLKYAA